MNSTSSDPLSSVGTSLYERVQAPLLERTLANEALARRAAELVRRAATLLGTGEPLRPEDRAQVRSLLSEMTERIDRPDLRRDLNAVLAQLDSLSDVPAASVVAGLMQEPPDRD